MPHELTRSDWAAEVDEAMGLNPVIRPQPDHVPPRPLIPPPNNETAPRANGPDKPPSPLASPQPAPSPRACDLPSNQRGHVTALKCRAVPEPTVTPPNRDVAPRARTAALPNNPTAPSRPIRPPPATTVSADVAPRAHTLAPTAPPTVAPSSGDLAPRVVSPEPTRLPSGRPATPSRPDCEPKGDVAPRARTPASSNSSTPPLRPVRAMPELAVTYPPRDFSGLRSGSQNPWGSIKHRRHRSHPPRDSSSLRSGAPNPWGSLCHRKYSHANHSRHAHLNLEPASTLHSEPVQHSHGTRQHSPLHPHPPPPAHPHPIPVHIFQVVCHPHGISPTKPKITKTFPTTPSKIQRNTSSARCACGNIIPAWRPDRRSRDRRFRRRSRRFGIVNEDVRYVWGGGHL